MKRSVLWSVLLFLLAATVAAFAQTNPTGTLTGVVTDPSAAAIPGAGITVTETATGRVYNAQSDATGRFVVADLSPGAYDVVVNHTGFQAGAYRAVQIVVGQTYTLKAQLKLGQVGTTVEVQAGQEVVQTQQTSIGNQVTGQQILQVPITSRNTTELAIMEPGAQTMSSPRNSQFDGLPPGALNITYDGINSQDNLLKSTTGSSFFSTEQPRVDDVQEFSITTAAADASESGEGAVQISIVSNKGTNQWHGGGWEYLRNDALNANNYFSNLASPSQPRQRLRLNEFGGKVGGPIIKNKLFFFGDVDIFRNPQGTLRQRNILTANAATGLFTYTPGAAQSANPATGVTCTSGANQTCTANLFTLAGAVPGVVNNTPDTLVQKFLAEEAAAVTAPGVSLGASTNPNNQLLLFNSNSSSKQIYPDLRLDYTINANNSLEFDYHYSYYNAQPDLLNNADATFPVAPFNANAGAQLSDRSLLAVAWRSQFSSTMTNELRVGGNSAPVWFQQGEITSLYPTISTSLGSIALRPTVPNNSLFSNPFLGHNPNSRNTALGQLTDTLNWLHGNHSMSFGTNLTGIRLKTVSGGQTVATAGLGLNSNDPAAGAFTPGTLPGIGSNDLSLAQTLYGELAGRVTSFNQTVNVNPNSRAYAPGFNNVQQVSQREAGVFFTDSWHMMPNLTFNYGLRWEWEGTPTDDLNVYQVANGALGIPGLYGVSGVGNLFKPGTLTGTPTTFINDKGQSFYPSYKKDFAPSVGLSWTPSFQQGWLQSLFGHDGQTVLRGGYSIAYDREGLNFFTAQAPANPGFTNNGFLTAAQAAGPAGSGLFTAGSIQLQSQNFGNVGQEETLPFGSTFPINPAFGDQVNAYDPGLRQPMIQSWSFGIQRQLDPNTAFEIRYVGNHGTREWRILNLNEANIFENNFLPEFNNAVANLNACLANQAACATAGGQAGNKKFSSFGDLLAGEAALPILTGAFTGSQTGSQTNANFSSGTFINDLKNGQAGSLANTLGTTFSNVANIAAANLAPNLFTVNPGALGGAFLLTDPNQSTYNGLQVELRRRMSNGLQMIANYTWSHSLGTGALQTIRNIGGDEAPGGSDLRHTFRLESLYELPFGPDRRWKSGNAWVDNAFGGWEWDGITRWQSGAVIQLTGGLGGTVNGNDGGVQLNGINVSQLASLVGVSKQTTASGVGQVFFAPNSLLGPGQSRSNQAILQSCTSAGSFCGVPYLYGPNFFKADWGLVKNVSLTEKVKLTVRANVLDAFNNPNFQNPSGNLQSSNPGFMRITTAYSDFNSSQDPGGRVIEFQARLSF